jgi:hypothetical protein
MYRDAEFRDPCVECGARSPARCPRCGDPCCAAHVYSDDGLCGECETEFLRRGAGVLSGQLRGAVIALGVAAALGAGAAGGGLVVALLGGVGAGFTGALAHLRTATRRRRYIDEHRSRHRRALNAAVTCGSTAIGSAVMAPP